MRMRSPGSDGSDRRNARNAFGPYSTLHTVRDDDGTTSGAILWESKRTKHWSDDWLPKLRDDQRAQSAACAVIVTQAMPDDVKRFGLRDGVWICEWPYADPRIGAEMTITLEGAYA